MREIDAFGEQIVTRHFRPRSDVMARRSCPGIRWKSAPSASARCSPGRCSNRSYQLRRSTSVPIEDLPDRSTIASPFKSTVLQRI